MKTWQKEVAVVAAVLASVALAGGARPIEWWGSLAVLVTFMHGQVGFRFTESGRADAVGSHAVECHVWMARYFMAKELLWAVYFSWLGAWSALAGVAVFLLYPFWRRHHIANRLATNEE